MNITKLAENDAQRWARAEMFFGEGAGIRRKHLNAEIMDKEYSIPGYMDAFAEAYGKQNMYDHALKAAKERKKIDRAAGFKRNAKGLLTGNRRQLSGVVLTGVSVYLILHETGMDKVLLEEGKQRYTTAKRKFNAWNAERKLKQEISNFGS